MDEVITLLAHTKLCQKYFYYFDVVSRNKLNEYIYFLFYVLCVSTIKSTDFASTPTLLFGGYFLTLSLNILVLLHNIAHLTHITSPE